MAINACTSPASALLIYLSRTTNHVKNARHSLQSAEALAQGEAPRGAPLRLGEDFLWALDGIGQALDEAIDLLHSAHGDACDAFEVEPEEDWLEMG